MGRELQTTNQQNKLALWAERVSNCRNSELSIKSWCKENGICEQIYYKWQKKLLAMAEAQHGQPGFSEVTPLAHPSGDVAVTVRIAGVEADIYGEQMRKPLEWCSGSFQRSR